MGKAIAGIVRNKWTHLEKKYYREALQFYDEVIYINPRRVTYRLDRNRNCVVVLYEGMVLNDLAMLYTLGRVHETLLLIKCLEMCGCPVSDPYNTVSRDCIEKLNDSIELFSAGVGTTTHILTSLPLAIDYFSKLDISFFPILNKPISGNRGKGIVPLYSAQEAIEFCQFHFQSSEIPLAFEQLMTYSREYRIYVVDGKTVEAYEKVRSDDSIVMNLHQGASPRIIEDAIRDQIFTFINSNLPKRYESGIYGIDLAQTSDGSYHIIEINRTPGFGGLKRLGLLNFPHYVHEVISKRARKRTPSPKVKEVYTLTFLGDTNPGETYQLRREELGKDNILKTRGYRDSFSEFFDFLDASHFTVANLEACITSCRDSPFKDNKPYLDWTDIEETPSLLKQLRIDAVSLANNHSLDFGAEGMAEALDILRKKNIVSFGAGMTEEEADQVLHHNVTLGDKKLHIIIASGYEFQRPHIRRGYYATSQRAGVKLWNTANVKRQIASLRAQYPDAFIIAYPHWGSNYMYIVERQKKLAEAIITAGADLIIGHGSHMMQEIKWSNGNWIIYGLGNFVYNSPGRYNRHEVMPFGLLARLDFYEKDDDIDINVKLYPTHIDNKKTDFKSHFVSKKQFYKIIDFFMPHKGENTGHERRMRTGKDTYGYYFSFNQPK